MVEVFSVNRFMNVLKKGNQVYVEAMYPTCFKIYKDRQFLMATDQNRIISFEVEDYVKSITILGYYNDLIVREDYFLSDDRELDRDRDFRPGDILVASDNVKKELSGYMGHSALVVNEKEVVEAVGGHPAITKDPIKDFLRKHPIHAQFRPKNKEVGEKVTEFALQYYEKYQENLDQGIKKPIFSFQLSQNLDDLWEFTYCSKLIWLCYHYGAGYTFENDDLWFSPEDLYHNLIDNEAFELVYRHPDLQFLIDT